MISDTTKAILNSEFEQALKATENLPQPDWVKHYQRYEENKKDYPLTESESRYSVRYKLPITVVIQSDFPIKGNNESDDEHECNLTNFYGLVSNTFDNKFEDVCEKYQSSSDGYQKEIIVTRFAKCVKCGEVQEITLYPLAVDRDYWFCDKCGKTHAHPRLGWGEPIV